MVRLLAEKYDTKSNIKLGWFRSQLQASYVSSYTKKLWYNEIVCLWMRIYIEREGELQTEKQTEKGEVKSFGLMAYQPLMVI